MFFVERREPGIKILLNKHNRKNNKKEEKIFAVQFKAYGTRQQLKQLKEFMKKEGIRYE